MNQYEICFPREYTDEIVYEVLIELGLQYDTEKLKSAKSNNGKEGANCVAFFKNNVTNEFVLVDCQNHDYLYSIVVRCTKEHSINAKNILLKWDNLARKEYGQDLQDDLSDNISLEKNLLNAIIKAHNLKLII